MHLARYALLLGLLTVLIPVTAATGNTGGEDLLFIADTPTEAALAVSTGADVAYGNTAVKTEITANTTVYEIGPNETRFDTVPRSTLPALVNASPQHGCPATVQKRIYAAMIASLNRNEVICTGETSQIGVSVDGLKERYIRRIAATGGAINHILVSSQQMLPAAAAIAADQHALLTVAGRGTDGGERVRTDGFEDGDTDNWRLQGDDHATLTTEKNGAMAGKHAAVLDAAGTGSRTGVNAYRKFPTESVSAGQTLTATVSFTQKDSHIPQIRYTASGENTSLFQLRFDPPGNSVWCKTRHGENQERSNFGGASATGTVYRVSFTLRTSNVTCTLFDSSGGLIASTTVDHPPGFTYATIDTVEIRSQDETPIDIHFDNVSVPAPGPSAGEITAGDVNGTIRNATRRLARHGLYLEGRVQYVDGLYLSLLGVPAVVKQDPVEAGSWSLHDPQDGATFTTDLPYGDLNHDGRIDAGVGRYPANNSLASRMYLRSKYYDGKQALVASEYLHANWPTILLYIGGGMFTGKSIETILEQQGFTVSRAVEYRASPEQFLVDLTPVKLEAVLAESDRIGAKIGSVLGQSMGTAASNVFLAVKAMEYVERTLEQYLEFDWATAGLDTGRARERLTAHDTAQIGDAAVDAAETVKASGSIPDGIVDAVEREGVQKAVAKIVYAFFWPDRYNQLDAETLVKNARTDDILYYNGAGNRSAWILPNTAATIGGVVKTGRYNGTDSFTAAQVPDNTAKLVFDNADMAGAGDAAMRRRYLRRGAAAYIGASTVNYAPFSAEIDTRFFKHGYTLGGSLKQAVNRFRRDSITWDPANILARNNVKGKMLRAFRLYGNPELAKDPVPAGSAFNQSVTCNGRRCTLTLTADLDARIVEKQGKRTITVAQSDGHLLRSFRPIIPVITAERVLPDGAKILEYDVSSGGRTVENITVPTVTPLSHGGRRLQQPGSVQEFPRNTSIVRRSQTVNGRTRVSFTHAAFQYNSSSRTAALTNQVTLTVRYRAPYEMDISVDDTASNRTTATVTVWNSGSVTAGDLILRLRRQNGTQTETRNTTLSPGKNRIDVAIPARGTGRRAVDAYLFAGNRTVGPRTDTFDAARPATAVNISVPPTVSEGRRFAAAVTIRNRRGPSRRQVHINGSAGVQTVFLQPSTTAVTVPRGESNVWRVPLRAFKDGNATVSVRTGSASDIAAIVVTQPPSSTGPGSAHRRVEDGFQLDATGGRAAVQIQQPQGRLHIDRTTDNATASLTTGNFQVQEVATADRRQITVSSGKTGFRFVRDSGDITRRVNGLAAEQAVDRYRQLLRAKQKLLERYRIARNETMTD